MLLQEPEKLDFQMQEGIPLLNLILLGFQNPFIEN